VDRERVRRIVLRAPVIDQATTPLPVRRKLVGVFAALAIVAVVTAAHQLWMSTTALLAAVRFEVRLAEDTPTPGLVVAQVGDSTRLIYLHPEIVVNNDDVEAAWVFQDTAGFGVALKFRPSGAQRMQRATTGHIGRPVAILIDGRVVSVPTLRGPISDSATINGAYTEAEAKRISDGIDRP
jgi:preprotein translocase subunit SecD